MNYTEVAIESATVLTYVPYAREPSFREYHCDGARELADTIAEINDPMHGEQLIDVDVNP